MHSVVLPRAVYADRGQILCTKPDRRQYSIENGKTSAMRDSFERIRKYYDHFDEWGRLDSPVGIVEKGEVINAVLYN